MPESSPELETPAAGDDTAAQNSDVNTASGASTEGTQGQEAQGSLADAVSAALKATTEGEGSPASQTQDPAKAKDPKADEPLPDEVSEDELKDQKPKTRKRIEQLLGKVKSVSTERDKLAPKAAEFDKIETFIRNNKLSNEDVALTFELAALVRRGDYGQALEKLTPIYQQLHQLVGNVLPTDLQERVRLGYLTEADARELHRSKTQARLADNRRVESEREQAEQRDEERRSQIIRDVSTAATAWETTKKTSDPDWHLKTDRVQQLLKLAVYEKGYPETVEAFKTMADEVYDHVSKEVRRLVPRPANDRKPAPTGGSSSSAVAEPKSLLDAVRIGLGR